MHVFVLCIMLVFSTVMSTLSLVAYVDNVPHEQPMIEFCRSNGHELKVYDSFSFECTNGGRFKKEVLKEYQ